MNADITYAAPADEDDLFAMLLDLHKENGVFQVSERKVREHLRLATLQQGGVIGLIRGPAGLEASMGLVIDQWWYTDDWSLSERWLYVAPGYRHKKHASHLIDWAKQCAAQLGEIPLQTGIISTTRTAAKEKMYARKMTPVGSLFVWDPKRKAVVTGINGHAVELTEEAEDFPRHSVSGGNH